MAHWNSRGLRGSVLEEAINFVNERYQKQGLALFQKIATPITPVKIDPNNGTITQAYFEKHSTVDYIGVAQGVAICFDAKETANKSLPLKNIHAHQIEFMQAFQKQGGLAFLLVHFTTLDKYFLLPIESLVMYYETANQGGRKSIPLEAFDTQYEIIKKGNGVLHYLEAVQRYNEAST
ncbi:MAG: Holliday junction resolvase RecU [Bacillota bacterium]